MARKSIHFIVAGFTSAALAASVTSQSVTDGGLPANALTARFDGPSEFCGSAVSVTTR